MEAFGTIGASALNFGLWGVAIIPAWLVIREVGVTYFGLGRGEYEAQAALSRNSEGRSDSGEVRDDSKTASLEYK